MSGEGQKGKEGGREGGWIAASASSSGYPFISRFLFRQQLNCRINYVGKIKDDVESCSACLLADAVPLGLEGRRI